MHTKRVSALGVVSEAQDGFTYCAQIGAPVAASLMRLR